MKRKWTIVSFTLHFSTKPRVNQNIEPLITRLDRLVAARIDADMAEGIPFETARRRHNRSTITKQALVKYLQRRLPLEMGD